MRWQWLFVGIGVLCCLTGCWDQRPVESRALVEAIGVAPTRPPGMLQWTFVFPNPTESVSSLASLKPGEKTYTISVTAPNESDALLAVQQRSPRALYLGQLRVLALSSQLPATEWEQIIDAFNRRGRLLKTYWIVTTNNPNAVVAPQPPSEGAPLFALHKQLSCRCQPYNWGQQGWQVWDRLATPGISPIVPDIHRENQNLSNTQLAVLGTQRVLVWSPVASIGWAYLSHQVLKGGLTVPLPNGNVAAVGRIRGTSHVQIRTQGPTVVVHGVLHYQGTIDEMPPNHPLTSARIQVVEQAVQQAIQQRVQTAIRTAEQEQVDPFGWHRDWRWLDDSPGSSQLTGAVSWQNWRITITVHFHVEDEGIDR